MTTRDPRNGKPGANILVVDDLETNLELLERVLTAQGYDVRTARDGEEALDLVAQQPPDVVLTDIRMPRCDGFGLCRELKSTASTRLIPVVLMTGASEADDRIQALEAGATDLLGKPIDLPELKARVRSLVQLKQFTDELDSAEVVLKTLALMIEARDAYTQGHCERLARYATALGERIGLSESDLVALTKGGYFHDLGKIAIPDSILLKPGPLTPEEFERMKEHAVIGEKLCGDLRALHDVRPIVRHHHEHLDGSGYPDHLVGDDVPRLAQIIGIVDVYDAITTDRPYRSALSQAAAFTALRDEVGRGWRDGELVEEFIATQV
jgi:putative two-component system response regulator